MSAAELARRSGLKPPTISNYLNHGSIPNTDSCVKLARALKLSPEVVTDAADKADVAALRLAEVRLTTAPSAMLDRAERIALALQNDPDVLDKWLDMGEAMAKVVTK